MTGRTEFRVREIHRRTRRYRQRYEHRALSSLTAFSLFLLAGIGALLQRVQAGGVSAVADGYGAVLLREGAGAYILVGIAAFAAGAALATLCIRHRKKPSGDRPNEDKEEKPTP